MENEKNKQAEAQQAVNTPLVSVRYLLIKWIQGHPIIDGAKYADTNQEVMNYYNSLPKVLGVEYTICRIYNVR